MIGCVVAVFAVFGLARSQPSQPQPLAALACRRMKPARRWGNGVFSSAVAMRRREAAGISDQAA